MWWIPVLIVVVVIVILVLFVISVYNKLVKQRNKVRNSWSQIDVQLKRRFDLIPNLVETIKGYAKHEKDILQSFADARKSYVRASEEGSIEGMAEADARLSKALNIMVNAVKEQYPELKADKHFSEMMDTLKDTEGKIAYARQFYNDVVLQYNNMREVFPTVVIANMFNFKSENFFKVEGEEKENVKVSF
ncbi:MAG: LemA family protein [Bacilli bacterium]|nr:LemA family protein [Bacilli bacterium]